MTHTRPRSTRVLLATATAVALLSSCGGKNTAAQPVEPGVTESPSASATPSESPLPMVSADPALAKKVPSEIAKSGTLDVGTDSTYAPSEFLASDGKTVQGFDIDLFSAVAAKLGLKAHFVSAPFANIIPSIDSGKYQVGVSSFSITADRLKTVDMVSYYTAGTQWATPAGNPAGVSPDDPCGKHVAVQTGTTQADDATARSKKCTDAGKKGVTLDQFQGQDQATAAVVSGKDDAMLADSPVIAYAVKQTGGKLAPLGGVYASASYGYVLKKGSTTFARAIADAVDQLIADGTYKQLLAHWGVEKGAIRTSQVDPKA